MALKIDLSGFGRVSRLCQRASTCDMRAALQLWDSCLDFFRLFLCLTCALSRRPPGLKNRPVAPVAPRPHWVLAALSRPAPSWPEPQRRRMSLTPRGDGAAAGAARSALAPYTPPASAEEMERMQLMRQAVQWVASDASGSASDTAAAQYLQVRIQKTLCHDVP